MKRSLLGLVLLAPLLATPGPADAADHPVVRRAGQTCTIVGTNARDRLDGTAGDDVICGLGGKDTIDGGGGNDVVIGGEGDDVLSGGSQDDRTYGGGGNDTITDYHGRSVVRAGPGDDTVQTGGFHDLLYGGPGDDDLDGGNTNDKLDGGEGTNICTYGRGDIVVSCLVDDAPVAVSEFSASQTEVDVTERSRTVRLRVHLTDATGVVDASVVLATGEEYQPTAYLSLVEGDLLDGWWEGSTTVRKRRDPGSWPWVVTTRDRGGNDSELEKGSLVVHNDKPDLVPPTVRLLTQRPGTVVELAPGGRTVKVSAEIADDSSGVDYAYVTVSFLRDGKWRYYDGSHLDPVGRAHPGRYATTIRLAGKVPRGRWNVEIDVQDYAQRWLGYVGPGMYADFPPSDGYAPFPDGAGEFTVEEAAR